MALPFAVFKRNGRAGHSEQRSYQMSMMALSQLKTPVAPVRHRCKRYRDIRVYDVLVVRVARESGIAETVGFIPTASASLYTSLDFP